LEPPAIAQFLGPGNRLISKVRVSSLDRVRDAIDLVAATVNGSGLVEHAIFGEDLVDGRTPTRGVVSPKTS
jgi:N-acetylglutamate synthase/N-acetylornithine aminotransferase